MCNKNKIQKAKAFAIQAHDSIGQKRKYSDEPYHVHPSRVAEIVQSVTNDVDVVAAAWLHDVLEDVAPFNQQFNVNKIKEIFGDRVLNLVLEVTDVSNPDDGNRAKRKAIDREHLTKASDEGKTIKLADLIDNIIDITKHDPKFAKIFKEEVMLDLPFLRSGDSSLYARLRRLIFE